MASKVTPLYAQTRILLNLWALDDSPVAKSNFIPKGKAYAIALDQLVENGELSKTPKSKSVDVYAIAESGKRKLSAGLMDESFCISGSVIGSKTTNAILQWFRQNASDPADAQSVRATNASSNGSSNGYKNGSVTEIDSYELFEKKTLATYDRLNQDYNLDNLVPIYRIRRELGDRLPRQKFNEWLLEVQSNDLVQLMASDQAQVTSDQMEDSITIPGAGTRFFMKRLK